MPLSSFEPGAIWPDTNGVHINAHGGGFLWHEGCYYWFGEHKIEGEAGNKAHVGVHVYSSEDLYNWQDRGIALAVSSDASSDIVKGCVIERPKVIYNRKSRTFVMWFHLELLGRGYGAALCGVATSDHVAGPYHLIRSFRPNAGHWPLNEPEEMKRPLLASELEQLAAFNHEREKFPQHLIFRRDFASGQMSRDMTLFVDDDGAAYHIAASEENGVLHISRLTDDFLSTSGQWIRVFAGRFHEAPAVFKHDGRYYMFSSDCTGWRPNPGRLSTASAMLGSWREVGNPCRGTESQRETTFGSQPTFVLPVNGSPGDYIFMADQWRPENAIDGRYVWLPIIFLDGVPTLNWLGRWDLQVFK
jgi:hypothetical protein